MNEVAIRTAKMLHQARIQGLPVDQISQTSDVFSTPEKRKLAYEIQNIQLELRQENHETLIGWKMGLTSAAKRKQMDLDSSLYGHLTDRMRVGDRQLFELKNQIHCKVEPEIAFVMKAGLQGHITRQAAYEAIGGVCCALEILDSRYKQFKYFSMEDVIADNSSSSYFVLGNPVQEFHGLNLADLKMEMMINGELAQAGNSKDISGDPVQSIVELCELLQAQGLEVKPGDIILAGAATQAVALESKMEVKLNVQGLPSAFLKVGAE